MDNKILKSFIKLLFSVISFCCEINDKYLKIKIEKSAIRLWITYTKYAKSSFDKNNPYVAQYYKNLLAEINYLIDLLEVIRFLKKNNSSHSLSCVKELYTFKYLILNLIYDENNKEKPKNYKNLNEKDKETKKPPKLGGLAKKIFTFIKENDKTSDNHQIFLAFSKYTPRTVRRHLRDLIRHKLIKRTQKGKTVTYTPNNIWKPDFQILS